MFHTFNTKIKRKPRPHDATDKKALAVWEKYADPTYYAYQPPPVYSPLNDVCRELAGVESRREYNREYQRRKYGKQKAAAS
jgi:hypothetical protein